MPAEEVEKTDHAALTRDQTPVTSEDGLECVLPNRLGELRNGHIHVSPLLGVYLLWRNAEEEEVLFTPAKACSRLIYAFPVHSASFPPKPSPNKDCEMSGTVKRRWFVI